MYSVPVIPKLIAIAVMAVALQRSGGTPVSLPQGPSAVPMSTTTAMQMPTTFEKFVSKLKLDSKKQLPEVQRILASASVDAEPVGREMIRLRLRMLEDARASVDLAPLVAEYAVQAGKMADIESKAFGDVKLLLNKSQASRSAEAFVLMAGIFQPPTPRSGGRRGGGPPQPGVLMSTAASFDPQRGGAETIIQGSRGGTGMRVGGARGPILAVDRETVLSAILFLDKDQKKQFKTIMDAAHKSALSLRDELTKTRAVMSSLIDQDAPPESLSQAAEAYGAPAAAMTAAEMKALAQVLGLLPTAQQPSANTIQTAAAIMRGSFLGKNWNTRVDERFY